MPPVTVVSCSVTTLVSNEESPGAHLSSLVYYQQMWLPRYVSMGTSSFVVIILFWHIIMSFCLLFRVFRGAQRTTSMWLLGTCVTGDCFWVSQRTSHSSEYVQIMLLSIQLLFHGSNSIEQLSYDLHFWLFQYHYIFAKASARAMFVDSIYDSERQLQQLLTFNASGASGGWRSQCVSNPPSVLFR